MSDLGVPPPTDFRADLVAVDAHTRRLLDTARGLAPDSLSGPSLCSGWTRGHVLCHVARNADALCTLVTNATRGGSAPMYASPQARDADIEAGSARDLAEQVADLETSAARFAAAAAELSDEVAGVSLEARNNTKVRAGFLPFMRLREVVFHHVDLDAGFGFADVEDELVLRFVEDTVRRMRANPKTPSVTIRTDEGDAWSVGDGQPTVSGSRVAVLGWLSRGLTDGMVGTLPALPFGG